MAKFRFVYTHLWRDEKVMEMTLAEKLFFVYLLTNEGTTQIGIYQTHYRKVAADLELPLETVKECFAALQEWDLIRFNEATSEVAIRYWGRYNFARVGKPIYDCVEKELGLVKDRSLISYVNAAIIHEKIRALYEAETVRGQNQIKQKNKKPNATQQSNREPRKSGAMAALFYKQQTGTLAPYIEEGLAAWAEEFPEEMVVEAVQIALDAGARKPFLYAEQVMKNWLSEGVTKLSEVKKSEPDSPYAPFVLDVTAGESSG